MIKGFMRKFSRTNTMFQDDGYDGSPTCCTKLERLVVAAKLNNDSFQSFLCWTMFVMTVVVMLPPSVVVMTEDTNAGCHDVQFVVLAHYGTSDWMEEMMRDFKVYKANKTRQAQLENPIRTEDVCYRLVIANEEMEKKYRPVIWQPALIDWLNVAERELGRKKKLDLDDDNLDGVYDPYKLVSDRQTLCRNITADPFGIITWDQYTENVPDQKIPNDGFAVAMERGQMRYFDGSGAQKFAPLYYTHGHPNSTSGGLLAVGMHIGLTGSLENSTAAERFAYFYTRRDIDLVLQMFRSDVFFQNAGAGFESFVIRINRKLTATEPIYDLLDVDPPRTQRLRFLYLNETFWANHPICILDEAPWVKGKKKKLELAKEFLDFVTQKHRLQEMVAMGLRPWDETIPLDDPVFSQQFGVNPNVTRRNTKVLPVPTSTVKAEGVWVNWQNIKKPVDLTILIDVSQRMQKRISSAGKNRWSFLHRGLDVIGKSLENRARITLRCFTNNLVPCGRNGDFEPDGENLGDYRTELHDFIRDDLRSFTQKTQRVFKALHQVYNDTVLRQREDDVALPSGTNTIGNYSYKILVISQKEKRAPDEDFQDFVANLTTALSPREVTIHAVMYFDKENSETGRRLDTVSTLVKGNVWPAKRDVEKVFEDIVLWF